MQLDHELWKQGQNDEITKTRARQDNIKNEGKIALEKKKAEQEIDKKNDDLARERKKVAYDITKEIYSDEKLLKMEYLRAQKKVYGRYCSNVNIHQMDGQDPYVT